MSDKLPSGFTAEDCRELFQVFNAAACKVGGADIPERVIIKRLKILSAWFLEAAESMAGISSEEAGLMDAERFWKSRAAGARGNDA